VKARHIDGAETEPRPEKILFQAQHATTIPMIEYPRWTANAIDTGMIVTTFSPKIRSRSRDALSIAANGCTDKPANALSLPPYWTTGLPADATGEPLWRFEIVPAALALTFCDLEIFKLLYVPFCFSASSKNRAFKAGVGATAIKAPSRTASRS
jgi:hypothetical protein